MFQSGIPFHETGNFKSHRTFLPDDQYGIALDNLVKGCTDILLLSPPQTKPTKIFTGRRIVQPQPDWWFIGGRIFPGETPIQSAQRLLSRELSLDISSSRFHPVCAQAFAFEMREQEPKHHGTTDVQFCLKVRLESEEEVRKVVLDEKEYGEWEWKEPREILEGNFHPALKYAVGCFLAGEALEELEECERRGGGDEEVAKLAREFLKRKGEVQEIGERGGNGYKLNSKELGYETTVVTKF